MAAMETEMLSTGIVSLDSILERVLPGDNIVWLVSAPEQYDYFAARFVSHCARARLGLTYVHFEERTDLGQLPGARARTVCRLEPEQGPEGAERRVTGVIRENGPGRHYVFDNLSALYRAWGDDEAFVRFFRAVCPLLYEVQAVAYFAMTRGAQPNGVVAKVRDTTQILIEVYERAGRVWLQPIKVWDRYSDRMFQPHVLSGEHLLPAERGGEASEVELLAGYHERAGEESSLSIREELIRSIVSDRPAYIRVARDYLTVADLMQLRSRIVGSGVIGGKAAGMLLSNRILRAACHREGQERYLEQISEPVSFYLGSDVYFNFLINNNLIHWLDLKHRSPEQMRDAYPELRREFQRSRFPRAIRDGLRQVVVALRGAPVIVRSSSLLEDSFETAFAGKYESVFLGNQGEPDECLESLLGAVRRVYASSLGPDALTYRRRRGLLEFQERMAVLIQRVEGERYRGLHFPTAAGVAFSRNPYPWSPRIDPRAGLVRLVFGLGTRAVDRVEADYPRLVALSHPGLHPDGDYSTSLRHHQRHIDAIDLEENRLKTLPIAEAVRGDHPKAFYIFSVFKDGLLRAPRLGDLRAEQGTLTVQFQNLLDRTDFVELMRYALETVEASYRYPVDIEFTLDVSDDGRVELCLVQCRPLTRRTESRPADLPEGLPPERVLFVTRRGVADGELHDLRYIAVIDPRAYDAVPSREGRTRLARAVGAMNHHPQVVEGRFALIGPGRWGSVNIELGVPVTYAEINNTALLMEMARPKDGYTPEVSYGTHFFQDLVEDGILYLPLYPEEPGCRYNEAFFERARNRLPELLPDYADMAAYLKIVDLPAAGGGHYLHVVMDRDESVAIGYLGPPQDE